MPFLEIHEFSTGIQVQGPPDNWESIGFTGGYMNATIAVPVPVQKAIANLEFDIASAPSEPTLLGREIWSNLEIWSVVAIITPARDYAGRSFPVHRYFLAKGAGNLGHILSWILQRQLQNGQLPTFNPFETQIPGQPTAYDTNHSRNLQLTPRFQGFLNQDPPVLIPHDLPCSALILNVIATEKSQQNGEPVSWAYNVEDLTKPALFQVIRPATDKEQQRLENDTNTTLQVVTTPPLSRQTVISPGPPSSTPTSTPTTYSAASTTSQPTIPVAPPPTTPTPITVSPDYTPPPIDLWQFILSRLQPMRIYLCTLAGTCFALIGWNVAYFILSDLGRWPPLAGVQNFPGLVLFPSLAVFLSVGIVLNEIAIGNPTRPKLNLSVAVIPLLVAIAVSLGVGLIAGGLYSAQGELQWPVSKVRFVSWLLVGGAVGLAEGLTWQFYSPEAGGDRRKTRRRTQRLLSSLFASLIASWVAGGLFGVLLDRLPSDWKNWEEFFGFGLLGLLIGFSLSIANSPTYLAALRAGKGFEFTGDLELTPPPHIGSTLQFVSEGEGGNKIEEGRSIQLPATGKVSVGSAPLADIFLPGVWEEIATIRLSPRDAQLIPDSRYYRDIEVNGIRLKNSDPKPLKHNYLITFHSQQPTNLHGDTIYRFVYYNRFLDPRA